MASSTFVLLLGGLLVIAFLAEDAMHKIGVPPVLVLIGCGLVLGPATDTLPAEEFLRVAPHFGALAFLLILFEGGLDLNLRAVLTRLAPGARLALAAFVGATAVGLALALAAGLSPLAAAALAMIMAPVSGAIVIPLSARLNVRADVRTLVVLEGAMSDVLGVLALGLLIQMGTGGGLAGLLALGSILAAAFSVVAAVVMGLVWPQVLRELGERRFLDVLTFGVALLLWGAAESVGASGALTAISFGLALANEHELLALFGVEDSPIEEITKDVVKELHGFISQLTFLVRAFFFAFLGAVVRFAELRLASYLLAGAMVLAIAGSRWLVIVRLERASSLALAGQERLAVWALQPRGLINVVLAIEALQAGVVGSEDALGLSSLVILGTNVLMAVGLRFARTAPPDMARS